MPDEGVSVRNVLEVLVEWLAGMAKDRMGPNWRRYFPLVGTMFFFILISNLMGLVPGLAGATATQHHPGWAVIAWLSTRRSASRSTSTTT
jgi:F0F1-type ATP synthase membrane subunit a